MATFCVPTRCVHASRTYVTRRVYIDLHCVERMAWMAHAARGLNMENFDMSKCIYVPLSGETTVTPPDSRLDYEHNHEGNNKSLCQIANYKWHPSDATHRGLKCLVVQGNSPRFVNIARGLRFSPAASHLSPIPFLVRAAIQFALGPLSIRTGHLMAYFFLIYGLISLFRIACTVSAALCVTTDHFSSTLGRDSIVFIPARRILYRSYECNRENIFTFLAHKPLLQNTTDLYLSSEANVKNYAFISNDFEAS
ncbi:hypothetical protein CBL_05273 [Carabus blaptoides fortunei]